MMKKAQGISINVIVITAIALLVLIVLVVVLTGRTQIFTKGLGTCRGYCVDSSNQCGDDTPVPTRNCDDGNTPPIQGDSVCCLPS